MIDPATIKYIALAAGAALLLWPLVPKFAGKALVSQFAGKSLDVSMEEAIKSLIVLRKYVSDAHGVDEAFEILQGAIVRRAVGKPDHAVKVSKAIETLQDAVAKREVFA